MQKGGSILLGMSQDFPPHWPPTQGGGAHSAALIGESRLALCHHLPATLILQEPDAFRILAKQGEGWHSASLLQPSFLLPVCN